MNFIHVVNLALSYRVELKLILCMYEFIYVLIADFCVIVDIVDFKKVVHICRLV